MACFQSISNEKPPLNPHWKLFSLETSWGSHRQCTLKVAHGVVRARALRRPGDPVPAGRLRRRAGWAGAVGSPARWLPHKICKPDLAGEKKAPNPLPWANSNMAAKTKGRLEVLGSSQEGRGLAQVCLPTAAVKSPIQKGAEPASQNRREPLVGDAWVMCGSLANTQRPVPGVLLTHDGSLTPRGHLSGSRPPPPPGLCYQVCLRSHSVPFPRGQGVFLCVFF